MAFLLFQANVNIEVEYGSVCRWLLIMWPQTSVSASEL